MNWILVLTLFGNVGTVPAVKHSAHATLQECRASGAKALEGITDKHGGFFRCTQRR